MKKIFYSIYTKVIIFILCIGCCLSAFNTGVNGLKIWDDLKVEVYYFEENFSKSYFLQNVVNAVSWDLYKTTTNYVKDASYDITAFLESNIDNNHFDYYVVVDDEKFTNMLNDYMNHEYYYRLKTSQGETIKHEMNPNQRRFTAFTSEFKGKNVDIYIGLKDQYINTCESIWNEQKVFVNDVISKVVFSTVAALIVFVYLVIVTGKDSKGHFVTYAIDRLSIELKLIFIAIVSGLALIMLMILISRYHRGYLSFELIHLYINSAGIVVFSIVLESVLSLVRNIKNKTIVSKSLLLTAMIAICNHAKKIINKMTQLLWNYTTISVLFILFIFTTIIGLLGVCATESVIFVLIGFILFMVLGYFVMVYLNNLYEIKMGVEKIKSGVTDYKIKKLTFKDLDLLKDGINEISNGLQESIDNAIKAERLKTELITNVSHDLKTPLTSIINYTNLLSQMDDLPEEAKDYIAIIDKKSQRLKTLTQDLFDISKIQTGNEELHLERLNVETLINQSLAEYESELAQLTIITNIENELYIQSDGRKMSRVLNNLLINIYKYSLPKTRVFISAYTSDYQVVIEMKNISSYPLDFDKDEIMQRFKRGDESRTDEGHGLGLAIVKSYVEATGGDFDIMIDGDMFKTIIKYNKL